MPSLSGPEEEEDRVSGQRLKVFAIVDLKFKFF
jgi:hypothetical protein